MGSAIVPQEPEVALTALVVVVDEGATASDDEVCIAVAVDVYGGEADAFDRCGDEVGPFAEGGESGLPWRARCADLGRAAATAASTGIRAKVAAFGNVGWSDGAAARGGTGGEEKEATDQPSWQRHTRPCWRSSGQCFLGLWWG